MKRLILRVFDYLIQSLGMIKPIQENPKPTDYIDCFYDPWYGDEIDHFWEEFRRRSQS